jgi:hypothetical protein
MSKPIKFELEFSGWQNVRLGDGGELLRPPTADEMAAALREHWQFLADDCESRHNGRMKVKLKRIS